jgi:hypothetical protein
MTLASGLDFERGVQFAGNDREVACDLLDHGINPRSKANAQRRTALGLRHPSIKIGMESGAIAPNRRPRSYSQDALAVADQDRSAVAGSVNGRPARISSRPRAKCGLRMMLAVLIGTVLTCLLMLEKEMQSRAPVQIPGIDWVLADAARLDFGVSGAKFHPTHAPAWRRACWLQAQP